MSRRKVLRRRRVWDRFERRMQALAWEPRDSFASCDPIAPMWGAWRAWGWTRDQVRRERKWHR